MASMRILLLVLAHLLASLVLGRRINSYAVGTSTYSIYQTSAGHSCKTVEMKFRTSHFNPMKRKENQTVTGYLYLPQGLNDTYFVKARVDRWANNEWKENYFVMTFPRGACTEMITNVPRGAQTLFKDGITRNPCSVRPRNYTLNNEAVDWWMPNFPILPYGEYRAVGLISQRGNLYLASCAEVSVIPKT